MGKIYCLMGKSSSGKDTIHKELLKNDNKRFRTIVSYTTRPIREGEHEGVEYHFATREQFEQFWKAGKIIEFRDYHTVHGIWTYFTADDGQIDLDKQDFMVIGTLDSYVSMRKYFGIEKMVPIYIEAEPGLRLARALKREQQQRKPKYAEMCRRFLADEEDFSKDKLEEAEIRITFINQELRETVAEIQSYLDTH